MAIEKEEETVLTDAQIVKLLNLDRQDKTYLKVWPGILQKKHLDAMPGRTLVVFLALAHLANVKREPKRVAEVTISQLARVLELDRSVVQKAFLRLEEEGYTKRHPDGWFVFEKGDAKRLSSGEAKRLRQNASGEAKRIRGVRRKASAPEAKSITFSEQPLLNQRRARRKKEEVREEEQPKPPASVLVAHENPFKFVAYWQDANDKRDFGVRFETPKGLQTFMVTEADRLGLKMEVQQLARLAQQSIETFKSTYSKRDGKGRTRGSRIGPKRLTEELVAWIRKDIVAAAKRSQPFQSEHERSEERARERRERAIALDEEDRRREKLDG